MSYLVTGVAGFIGYHLTRALLDRGEAVAGIDSINDYYDPVLKRARLALLEPRDGFTFEHVDIADRDAVFAVFARHRFATAVHFAAQAGVRYSLSHPEAYARSNLVGFQNMIDAARSGGLAHFVYASTSSVYGLSGSLPFSVGQGADHPTSLYAATKKSNELVAHAYSHVYGLPTTGLRLFTVYGPWGRPDMAPYLFTSKILNGEPVQIYNNGDHARDFTFIDDCVAGIIAATDRIAEPNGDWRAGDPDPGSSSAPFRIYNVGFGQSVPILDFIAEIEKASGRSAIRDFQPFQRADMHRTHADISRLTRDTGYRPSIPISIGVPRYVAWFRDYYRV